MTGKVASESDFRKAGYIFPDAFSVEAPLGRVDEWSLQRVLATGGFAFIVLARNSNGDVAALKFPKFRHSGIDQQFLLEGRIGRQICSGIERNGCDAREQLLRYYAVNEAVPYIAMEYVSGRTDDSRAVTLGQAWHEWRSRQMVSGVAYMREPREEREPKWDSFVAAATIWQLARGVAELHKSEGQYLHGDLHPGNVLLTRHFDQLVMQFPVEALQDKSDVVQEACELLFGSLFEPVVKLIDFGLCRPTRPSEYSNYNSMQLHPKLQVGVAPYMAPEQFAFQEQQSRRYQGTIRSASSRKLQSHDRKSLLSPATDVYSIGCMLFELLTGYPPYIGNASTIPLRQQHDEPLFPRPRHREEPICPDLRAICLSALRREPQWRRYRDASELASDLSTWLSSKLKIMQATNSLGKPHSSSRVRLRYFARPLRIDERVRRWAGRNRVAAVLIPSVIALLLSIGFVFYQRLQLRGQQQAAESERLLKEQHVAHADAIGEILEGVLWSTDPLGVTFQSMGTSDLFAGTFAASAPQRADIHSELNVRRMVLDPIRAGVESSTAIPLKQARLLNVLGRSYRSIGEIDDGRELIERALSVRRRELGELNDEVAESLTDLGWVHQDSGDFAKAEDCFRKALKIKEELHGKRSLAYAATQLHLAWLLADICHHFKQTEKSDEAESHCREALATRQSLLGQDARETGIAQLELGPVLYLCGKDLEAKVTLLSASAVLSQYEDTRPFVQLFFKYFEANQLRSNADATRLKECKLMYRELLEDVERRLGPRHPIAMILLGDYAGLLKQMNEIPAAIEQIKVVLDRARTSPLRNHPYVIVALNELADVLRHSGDRHDREEAERLYIEAKECSEKLYGTEDRRTKDIAQKAKEVEFDLQQRP